MTTAAVQGAGTQAVRHFARWWNARVLSTNYVAVYVAVGWYRK